MADEADVANDFVETEMKRRLSAVNLSREVEPTGECLNCGETVKDERRWCSAHCTRDWENRSKNDKR